MECEQIVAGFIPGDQSVIRNLSSYIISPNKTIKIALRSNIKKVYHMKFCADFRLLLPICAVLLVLAAGCLVPSSSTSSPPGTNGITQSLESGDAEFLSLYENSQEDIATRLERMNRHFPVGAAMRNVPYLPSELRSTALDLKTAADTYHASMIRIESFEKKENELQRNEYLKYLSTIRKVAGDIAGAGDAEMNGEFGLAQNYAESARDALRNPDGIPGTAHENLIKDTRVSLDDYIQKMREKRV